VRDEVGDISLIPEEDRVVGPGTSPIMAAFTHVGVPSRFTPGHFGLYYAGLQLETALKESVHSRTRFLSATREPAQEITLRCYRCKVNAILVDVRHRKEFHHPTNLTAPQAFGVRMKAEHRNGILYRSVRNPEGECIAALKPNSMVPPAVQTSHCRLFWNGETIERAV